MTKLWADQCPRPADWPGERLTRPLREPDGSPVLGAEGKDAWNYNPTSSYAVRAWRLLFRVGKNVVLALWHVAPPCVLTKGCWRFGRTIRTPFFSQGLVHFRRTCHHIFGVPEERDSGLTTNCFPCTRFYGATEVQNLNTSYTGITEQRPETTG